MELLCGVVFVLVVVILWVIGNMERECTEKVKKEEKEIDTLKWKKEQLLDENKLLQNQLPAFPSSSIEEMEIPGEIKTDKRTNDLYRKFYGISV